MNVILRAASFAQEAHKGQVRKFTREPYINHPARVAGRTALLSGATEEMVAAAFLHDVLEDTSATALQLSDLVSQTVIDLVVELTNASNGSKMKRAERKKMDREWLKGASPAAKRIKMIDRIDNLQPMIGAPISYMKLYAEESVLLADSIGDADLDLKGELLDAAHAIMKTVEAFEAIQRKGD